MGSSIVLDILGNLYGCGNCSNGQLGESVCTRTNTLTRIPSDIQFSELSSNDNFTAGIDSDGNIQVWGFYMQKKSWGVLASIISAEMTQLESTTKFIKISSSALRIVALDVHGDLYTHGNSDCFELRLTGSETTSELTLIEAPTKFTQISCGHIYSMAIDVDGNLWKSERLESHNSMLVLIPSKVKFSYVSCGYNHAVAISTDGDLYAYGQNSDSQLGLPGYRHVDEPTRVQSNVKFSQISTSHTHTMGLDEHGYLHGCGNNSYGKLGLGDMIIIPNFVVIIPDRKFSQVRCSRHNTLALDEYGNLYSCGNNQRGQLGLGDYDERRLLTRVDLPECLKDRILTIMNYSQPKKSKIKSAMSCI